MFPSVYNPANKHRCTGEGSRQRAGQGRRGSTVQTAGTTCYRCLVRVRRPGVERVVTAELSKPDMPIWLVAVSGHGPRWRHSPQADRRHGAGIAAALAALCSARLSASELEITAARLTAARSRRRTAGDRQRRGRRAERREDGRRGGGRTSGSLTDDGTGG